MNVYDDDPRLPADPVGQAITVVVCLAIGVGIFFGALIVYGQMKPAPEVVR